MKKLTKIGYRLNLHYLVPGSITLAILIVLLMRFKLGAAWDEAISAAYVVMAGLLLVLLIEVLYFGARIFMATRKVKVEDGKRLRLLYDLCLSINGVELMQLSQQTLEQAEQELQHSLRHRPFPNVWIHADDRLFKVLGVKQVDFGGLAQGHRNVIHIIYDGSRENLEAILRHEWTHLITYRWSKRACPFFSEGIAVAVQRLSDADTLHREALTNRLACPYISLAELAYDDAFFRDLEWRPTYYKWAGSFVRFLLDCCGLARFRRFYSSSDKGDLGQAFQQVYGCSLARMEADWHAYLFARQREEWLQSTSLEALERQVWCCVHNYDWYLLRVLGEYLVQLYPSRWQGYFADGFSACLMGQYKEALTYLERAAGLGEQEECEYRGYIYLLLGQAYDILDQREHALTTYRRVLELPEVIVRKVSSHERAKSHLNSPYTWEVRFHRTVEHLQKKSGHQP